MVTSDVLEVDMDRCIACGACVSVCTQNALLATDESAVVAECLEGGAAVAVLTPEVRAAWSGVSWTVWQEALTSLGFLAVEDGSAARQLLDFQYREVRALHESGPLIRSSCPVVVNLVEQFRPDLIDALVPLATESEVQSRLVREVYPKRPNVVLITSCLGAKTVVDRDDQAPVAVISMSQLLLMLEERGIKIDTGMLAQESAPFDPQLLLDQLPQSSGADSEAIFHDIHGCGQCATALNGTGPRLSDEQLRPLSHLAQAIGFSVRPPHVREVSSGQLEEQLLGAGLNERESRLDCMVCGYQTCQEQAAAVVRGYSDWSACLPLENERLRSALTQFQPTADADVLTGLLNRVGLERALDQEMKRAVRYSRKLTLATFRIAEIDEIITRYGRRASDRAIVLLTQVLAGQARESDTLALSGPHTFALLLPETGERSATAVFERLREKVAATVFWLAEDVGVRLLIRAAAVELNGQASGAEALAEAERAVAADA